MEKFEFHLDKKVTIWYREYHYIEADSLQEAQKKMIYLFADGNVDETFDYQEAMDDTWEDITPKENNGMPTAELWCEESGMLLIDNVENQPMI